MIPYLYHTIYSFILGFFEVFPLSGGGLNTLLGALLGSSVPAVGSSWIWGTLLGSLLVFRHTALNTAKGFFTMVAGACTGKFKWRKANRYQVMSLYCLLAALPLAVMLVILQHLGLGAGLGVMGLLFLASAALLFIGDHTLCRETPLTEMTAAHAVKAALFQAVALVPGFSRTGIGLGTTLNMGFKRQDAFDFAFMLTLPALTVLGLWNLSTFAAAGRLTALFSLVGGALGAALAGWLVRFLFRKDYLNVAVFCGAAAGIVSIIISFVR